MSYTATGILGADGGGIENKLLATLSMTTTLLSDNLARAPRTLATGGGLFNALGASASLIFSAVTGNTVSGSPGQGGGVFNSLGMVISFLSLVTGNTPDNCFPPGTIAGCTN